MTERSYAPTVVFVHALNPYGFANNRRVNEENIDLNRNFLQEKDFTAFADRDPNFAGFDDIGFLLNSNVSFVARGYLVSELYSYYLLAYSSIIWGIPRVRRALLSGNYRYPEGLGFGGRHLARSGEILLEILETEPLSGARDLVVLDVHTGLGPSGGTLCSGYISSSTSLCFYSRHLGVRSGRKRFLDCHLIS
jgi:hypothetical protein